MRTIANGTILLSCLVALTGCPVDGYAPAPQRDAGEEDAGGEDAAQDAGGARDVSGEEDAADSGGADAMADTGGESDSGVDASDAADAEPTTCVANQDGVVAWEEVILRPGLSAKFTTAEDVTVDLAGEALPDGGRLWDLRGPYAGDASSLVELMSLDGKWYRAEFPEATYASKLADGEDEVGVFGVDADGLYLQGVVTPDEGVTRTELSYDPAATILRFPMARGDSWRSESTVSGWYLGGFWTATEVYTSQVDAEGELRTPYGDLPVLRVQTVLERTVGLLTTTIRSYAFVSECFGTVATVTSRDNEGVVEFSEAAAVRRLSR